MRETRQSRAASRSISAGTHPFSRYEHQDVTDKPRYAELVEALQWAVERQLIFGLHVHVGLERAQQAIAVANALRTWLPELLALSANSPFWHGRDTGLASTRSKVFDAMPRSGLPPAFECFEEFERLVDRGVRTAASRTTRSSGGTCGRIRGSARSRSAICDAQTRLENVAAIVALVQSLTATLAARFEREGRLDTQPRTLIAENKWRAVRYGLDATLVDLARDEERPGRARRLRSSSSSRRPRRNACGCADELGLVDVLLARGDGASRAARRL